VPNTPSFILIILVFMLLMFLTLSLFSSMGLATPPRVKRFNLNLL
jgi:hypothetical protein